MRIILKEIEKELKHRFQYPYKWYRKQDETWDAYTNFIYNTAKWEHLPLRIENIRKEHQLDNKELFYYSFR